MGIVNRLQSWFSWFRADPVGFLIYLLYFAASILLTLMLHEIAHGYVAWKCGDPTAKMLGRLSMDPRKHLDPLGTVFLIFFGFGWAKPVPVNPRNLTTTAAMIFWCLSLASRSTSRCFCFRFRWLWA